MQKFPSHDSVVTRRRFEDSIFLRLKQSQEQQESRGERSHVTELNHIPIDTVATVATVATRRVDKHRTCVRGRRMRAKAAVRDLSAVNLEHARSLHGHLPGNYMVPYLQLRQPDLTFSSLRPGCALYRLHFARKRPLLLLPLQFFLRGLFDRIERITFDFFYTRAF